MPCRIDVICKSRLFWRCGHTTRDACVVAPVLTSPNLRSSSPLSSRDAAESYDPNINASNRHQVAVPRSLCPRLASTTSASPALFRMDMNHGSPTATSSGAMSSSTGAAGGSMSMGGGCKISMLWNWFVFDIGSDHAEAETPRWAPRPLGTLSAPASSRRTGRSKAS